ncbi:MAG: phosphoenolpyruvate kinase [Vicinamibacterales bacterium]
MSDASLSPLTFDTICARLTSANLSASARYPGDSNQVQPVHTMYGGAHLFTAEVVTRMRVAAITAFHEYAPDAAALAAAFGLTPELAARVHPRVEAKLASTPVEDFRIDFEDGFGHRADTEEDRFALKAADEVAAAHAQGTLPAGIGIRIKTLNEELKRRSLRTLDLFLTRLLSRTGRELPSGFTITLPKITAPAQVAALADALDAIEAAQHLPAGVLRIELMVETTQSIYSADGTVALPALIVAGRGRVVGAHFGTYDYTAGLSITAAHQHMRHAACDFAKHVMQVALAGSGIHLSDGATHILPVGPHRGAAGTSLTEAQRRDNREVVHRAWRLHAENIRHSLVGGFYQGWDLHPAQLPSRYVAVYVFFLEGLAPAAARLHNFVAKAAQATLVGDVFDDAATGQGLLNYFLRAMACGAISETEAVGMSGLSLDELRGRSFLKILNGRAAR